jgi:hypothetical protein
VPPRRRRRGSSQRQCTVRSSHQYQPPSVAGVAVTFNARSAAAQSAGGFEPHTIRRLVPTRLYTFLSRERFSRGVTSRAPGYTPLLVRLYRPSRLWPAVRDVEVEGEAVGREFGEEGRGFHQLFDMADSRW